MQQLILDLAPPPAPRLDNFVGTGNRELLSTLSAWATQRESEPFIYLWGEPGSGKTHLLQAALADAREMGHMAFLLQNDLLLEVEAAAIPGNAHVAVDDVHCLNPAQQIAVFALFNRLKEGGGAMLSAGPQPPMQLDLRDDLTTRLGWGLTYRVNALSDSDKTTALQRHARNRGIVLAPEVCDYLLRHYRRDLPSLLNLLDLLDRESLALKRPITLPLVRNLLLASAPFQP